MCLVNVRGRFLTPDSSEIWGAINPKIKYHYNCLVGIQLLIVFLFKNHKKCYYYSSYFISHKPAEQFQYGQHSVMLSSLTTNLHHLCCLTMTALMMLKRLEDVITMQMNHQQAAVAHYCTTTTNNLSNQNQTRLLPWMNTEH